MKQCKQLPQKHTHFSDYFSDFYFLDFVVFTYKPYHRLEGNLIFSRISLNTNLLACKVKHDVYLFMIVSFIFSCILSCLLLVDDTCNVWSIISQNFHKFKTSSSLAKRGGVPSVCPAYMYTQNYHCLKILMDVRKDSKEVDKRWDYSFFPFLFSK